MRGLLAPTKRNRMPAVIFTREEAALFWPSSHLFIRRQRRARSNCCVICLHCLVIRAVCYCCPLKITV